MTQDRFALALEAYDAVEGRMVDRVAAAALVFGVDMPTMLTMMIRRRALVMVTLLNAPGSKERLRPHLLRPAQLPEDVEYAMTSGPTTFVALAPRAAVRGR